MKNLVLVGFMGSGKTTVGRLAAAELGLRFVDMDRYIEEKEGVSIPNIFARQGEEAFREMESREAEALGSQTGLVIATGGGVILRPSNLKSLGRNGVLIYLHVDAETALARTSRSSHRPLLKGEDPAGKIRALLSQRQWLYERIPNQVNTIGRIARDICADVVRIYRGPFPIHPPPSTSSPR